MFYGPADDEGRPTHKPSEGLTLVIDHRLHAPRPTKTDGSGSL